MMRLPSFRYVGARHTSEALDHLSGDPKNVRLVAGGTDLWPNMKRRHQQAETVVGLRDVSELYGIQGDAGKEVSIGAMTSLTDVCNNNVVRRAYPGLARAVASISSPVLRNMGTLGGNLCLDTRCTYYNQNEEWRQSIDYCMKEQGNTCWVATKSSRCWAISASDSAPLLCAIDAKVRVRSKDAERLVPVRALYQDDGIDYLKLQRDEILTHVLLPAAGSFRSTYWKLRRRGSIDFPVLGVGTALWLDKHKRVSDVHIFLGAVASAPIEATSACDFLRGKELNDETIEEAGRLARKFAAPLDNTDYEIPWRMHMVDPYVEGTLRELAGLPHKIRAPLDGLWAIDA